MKKIALLVVLFILVSILIGCISNDRFFQVNIKSSHTWSLDVKVEVNVWENYSLINNEPDFYYSEVKKLYVNEVDIFDVDFKLDEIGYVQIIVNASTIDGFYDVYEFSSFDLDDTYYFDIIGSGNEVKIIKLN